MKHPIQEVIDALQNEADFESVEVEKAIIDFLEVIEADLKYVQYEWNSDIDDKAVEMNKRIAKANSELEVDDDDDDEDDDIEETLDLDDDEDDDEENDLDIPEEIADDDEPDESENESVKPPVS